MTITYQYRVANVTLGTFVKLLFMWKGSVYKLLYKEMLIFSGMYIAISLSYRMALDEHQKELFEAAVLYCDSYLSLIPVSFVLGFYVTMVVQRWWTQFMNVPWPDRTLYLTCCYLEGRNDKGHRIRVTIARYMLFGLILICRSISVAVMKRFPTLDHLVEAGFITKEEAQMYEEVDCKYNKFWVPLVWANGIIAQARKDNYIKTDFGLRMIIEAIADFRDRCSTCFVYDWITIPLVYTQVVTLAVYTFFGTCLVGRQFLDPAKSYPGHEYDFYVPVFTLLQFFFYMGWLKVAEQLINPFGEDDDDFDINWLLDRHMAVAMTLVDQMYGKYPPIDQDSHFEEVLTELPYTEASLQSKKPMFLGSTYNLAVPSLHDQRMINPVETEEYLDHRQSSFGGHFAGSMLSILTGRTSVSKHGDHSHIPFDRISTHSGNYYMDHLHNPNGNVPNVKPRNLSFIERSEADRKLAMEITNARRGSAWASESNLQDLDEKFVGRQRANTVDDGKDTDISKPMKRRKISFPLNLLRRLRKHSSGSIKSQRSQSGSSKSIVRHDDFYVTPEYVPLKRASHTGIMKRKDSSSDRKRKISFPLAMTAESGDSGINEPDYRPEPVMKPSRFTVEQVPGMGGSEESVPIHVRNAQKVKDAISGKNVSRAPVLSAIEEGGTITSISQILPDDSDDEGMNLMDDVIHEADELDEEATESNKHQKHERENQESKPKTIFKVPEIKIDLCEK